MELLRNIRTKLEAGITADRHGMIIIQNEGILDILRNGRKRAT